MGPQNTPKWRGGGSTGQCGGVGPACIVGAIYSRESLSCALNLRGYYAQFTDKEAEAQSWGSTYSWQVATPEFQPTFSCLYPHVACAYCLCLVHT